MQKLDAINKIVEIETTIAFTLLVFERGYDKMKHVNYNI